MADDWQHNVEQPPDLSFLNQLFAQQQQQPQNPWATEPLRQPGQLRQVFTEDPQQAYQQANWLGNLLYGIARSALGVDASENVYRAWQEGNPEKMLPALGDLALSGPIGPDDIARLAPLLGMVIGERAGKIAPKIIDTAQFGQIPQKQVDQMLVDQLMKDLAARKKGAGGLVPGDITTPEFAEFSGSNVLKAYHGTKRDFSEFKAKYPDDLLFFSTNPEFAGSWPVGTGGPGHLREPPPGTQELYDAMRDRENELFNMYRAEGVPDDTIFDVIKDTMKKETGWRSAYDFRSNAGVRVMPVYLSVKNPFDPRKDYKVIEDTLKGMPSMQGVVEKGLHKEGNWVVYENKEIIDALKQKGYDGIYLAENVGGPHETIAVFSPNQVKSAFNQGSWSKTDPDIMKSFIPIAAGTGALGAAAAGDNKQNRQPVNQLLQGVAAGTQGGQ